MSEEWRSTFQSIMFTFVIVKSTIWKYRGLILKINLTVS